MITITLPVCDLALFIAATVELLLMFALHLFFLPGIVRRHPLKEVEAYIIGLTSIGIVLTALWVARGLGNTLTAAQAIWDFWVVTVAAGVMPILLRYIRDREHAKDREKLQLEALNDKDTQNQ